MYLKTPVVVMNNSQLPPNSLHTVLADRYRITIDNINCIRDQVNFLLYLLICYWWAGAVQLRNSLPSYSI